jgi:hypothetical protein
MEQSGQERLEILREGMARLEFMTEERRGLQKELEWRRSMMGWEGRPLELDPLRNQRALRIRAV